MTKMFLVFCATLLCLPACSRIDIAYRWADTFIASKVDDYFDISSRQSRDLKQSLQKDFRKIQADVIPGWIDEAKKLEKDVATNSLNEKRIATLFGSVLTDIETLPVNFTDTAVRFISSAEDKQLVYFANYFAKKNQEDLNKFKNSKKFERDYREKYVKYFEMFLGSLTSEQSEAITKHIARSPYPTELKFKNREWMMQQFLKERGKPEALKEFVRQFAAHPQKFQLPEYKRSVKAYQADLERLVIEVAAHMTDKQKKTLQQALRDKVAQLEKIHQRT